MAMFEANDPGAADKMREMLGPGDVDQLIRQAIHLCWMMLPAGKRTIDELERQLRRIVERAIKDLREDTNAFGLGK
jgi:hypothetical protein